MNSWQKYVKDHKGPGVTLKKLAAQYRMQKGGQAGQATDLKITGKYKCNGDCSQHVAQLNVYIKYLHKVLAEDVLKADKISDTAQIVIFCNLWMVNLVSYYFDIAEDNDGQKKNLTEADIKEAIVRGNDKASESETLKFRTSFFQWMGSDDYADLLNRIDLGCAVNTTDDMKNDYIIKVASMAYGLQTLFAESDLNEVHQYKTASWFNDFIKLFKRHTIAISDACMPHVSAARKGLQMLASVGRAAYATGKAAGQAAVYVAPYLGKAAVATGKGVVYAAPIAGKAAWYTGEKAWYTTAATAKLVGKIPVVGTVAKRAAFITLVMLDITAGVLDIARSISEGPSTYEMVMGPSTSRSTSLADTFGQALLS